MAVVLERWLQLSSEPTISVTDREKKKFRDFGSGAVGTAVQAYGETSGATVLPIKVVDDGNGYGKLVLDASSINHGNLGDMPDAGGTNTDHDARYFTHTEVLELIEGAAFSFHPSDTADGVIAGYNIMFDEDTGEAESTIVVDITANDTLIKAFITESDQPTFTSLSAGVYAGQLHLSATTAGKKDTKVYWTLSKRAAGGAETLLITSEESAVLTNTNTHYAIHGSLTTDQTILSDDRLVFKVYGNQDTGAGGDATATIYMEGTTATRIDVQTHFLAFDDRYVQVAGDTMSGDLDMGTNSISNIASISATGSIVTGTNAIALGHNLESGGGTATSTASGDGSVILGHNHSTGNTAIKVASGNGSMIFASNRAFSSGNSTLTAAGLGSCIIGHSSIGSAETGSIQALAQGDCVIGYNAGDSDMIADGPGAIVLGYSVGSSPGSQTHSYGNGSLVAGYNINGNLFSLGSGSIAMGYASANNTLQATGNGSIALGQDVQATTNNNVLVFGESFTNSTDSSCAIGFGQIDVLIASGAVTHPNNATLDTGSGSITTTGNLSDGTYSLTVANAWLAYFHVTSSGTSHSGVDGTVTIHSDVTNAGSGLIITDGERTNLGTAYDYSQVGHLPLAGGTMAGGINMNTNAITGGGAGHDQFSDFVSNEHIDWTSTSSSISTTGTITSGDITIFDVTPILVFKDSNGVGGAATGFIEWRDSNNTRLGTLGNGSSGTDDLNWKNESSGGHINIETVGGGDFKIFATTVITGVPTSTAYDGASLVINPATATADYLLQSWSVANSMKASIDEDGDFTTIGTVTGEQITSTDDIAVPASGKYMLEGTAGDTYIVYNSGTPAIEVYLNNIKVWEF